MTPEEHTGDHSMLIRMDERLQSIQRDLGPLKELPPRVQRLENAEQARAHAEEKRERVIARILASLVVAAVLGLFSIVWKVA